MQTSLQTTTNALGKFWTHTEVKHAQDPDFTILYPANIGGGGSWIRGKRIWSGDGKRGKAILGFLLWFF